MKLHTNAVRDPPGRTLLTGITRRSDAPYEVFWDRQGVLAMTMPIPEMVYMGPAKQVMPGIRSWEMVVVRTGIVLEIWAGANHYHGAIDVYHRIVLRNVRTPNRLWHNIVHGCGTEPASQHIGCMPRRS